MGRKGRERERLMREIGRDLEVSRLMRFLREIKGLRFLSLLLLDLSPSDCYLV